MTAHTPITLHPVVLRFAEMFPSALPLFEVHRRRSGGDLDHIDADATPRNRLLIGGPDWAAEALAEIEYMRHENLAEELAALKAAKRKKDMDARIREGLKDPWKASKGGPLREVILTANRSYFDPSDSSADPFAAADAIGRAHAFEACAVEWLTSRFGADVIHARADHDETAYHIHAVILPRAEKVSARRGRQRLLQPSVHPLIADYEAAQDDVGSHFATIGLRRGDRTAAARRAARAANMPLPPKPRHTSPAQWRAEQARKSHAALSAEQTAIAAREAAIAPREAALMARESEVEARATAAEATLAVAEAIATGAVEFEPNTGKPISKTPEALALRERAQKNPEVARKALSTFQAAYTRLATAARTDAVAAAQAQVADARAALAAAMSRAETMFGNLVALRDRMVAALPASLRATFQNETRGDLGDAKRALNALGEANTAASLDPTTPRKPHSR